MPPMPVTTVFARSDRALERVVLEVRQEQWDEPVPGWFQTRDPTGRRPTLREVIGYHASDEAWVPDMLAGRTIEQAPARADGAVARRLRRAG